MNASKRIIATGGVELHVEERGSGAPLAFVRVATAFLSD